MDNTLDSLLDNIYERSIWQKFGLYMPKMKKNEREANSSYAAVATFEQKLKKQYQAGYDFLSVGFGWDVVDRMEWGNVFADFS